MPRQMMFFEQLLGQGMRDKDLTPAQLAKLLGYGVFRPDGGGSKLNDEEHPASKLGKLLASRGFRRDVPRFKFSDCVFHPWRVVQLLFGGRWYVKKLMLGDLQFAKRLIPGLATVLGVDADEIEHSIQLSYVKKVVQTSSTPSLAWSILIRVNSLSEREHEKLLQNVYGTKSKGIEQIYKVLSGDLNLEEQEKKNLATFLDAQVDDVDLFIQQSRAEGDAEWHFNFKPHAIAIAHETRPSPIFIYVMGGQQDRYISFPRRLTANQYSEYARENVPQRIHGLVDTIGYVVNYAQTRAIKFDLSGKVLEELDEAYRPGEAWLEVGNQQIS